MLGTWFRYKYPHVIDGVIAGSAPIWNFEGEVGGHCETWRDTFVRGSLFVMEATCMTTHILLLWGHASPLVQM